MVSKAFSRSYIEAEVRMGSLFGKSKKNFLGCKNCFCTGDSLLVG